jgi:hypothetical protein
MVLTQLGSEPVEIGSNEFYEVNVEACLKELRRSYPEGVPVASGKFSDITVDTQMLFETVPYDLFYTKMGYDLNEQGEPVIPTESEMKAKADQQKTELLKEARAVLEKLDALLPKFTTADRVHVINREFKVSASPGDRYIEVNQANLKKFIQEKVLKEPSQEQLDLFCKAYNLQYRLQVYSELAQNPDAVLNRTKLREDLSWASTLLLNF